MNQNMIKLSLMKQILDVNDHVIVTSPPRLRIFVFFEVTPPLPPPFLFLMASLIDNRGRNSCCDYLNFSQVL